MLTYAPRRAAATGRPAVAATLQRPARSSSVHAPNQTAHQAASSVRARADAPLRVAGVPVGHPADPHEREARAAAAAIAAGRPAPRVSGDGTGLARRVEGPGRNRRVANLGLGAGAPLSPARRAFYERRLGTDLGQVRVHRGAQAEQAAEALQAKAFTLGRDVVLGARAPDPRTPEGERVFTHELVHAAQQTTAGPFTPDTAGVVRREHYCTPGGGCWHEDPLLGTMTPLDYTPADAIMVSAPGTDPLVAQLAADPVADILSRLAMLDLQVLGQQRMLDPTSPWGSGGAGAWGPADDPSRVVWLGGGPEQAATGWGAAGRGAEPLLPWLGGRMAAYRSPYYYRFLASYDPTIAQIRGGADLFPPPLDPSRTFRPAASQAEMTFRHLRPGGNVLQIGSNRISTGRNLNVLIELAEQRGTGQIVRIDPQGARAAGSGFLEFDQIMRDLDTYEAQVRRELDEARAAGRGKNAIKRIENRLNALEQARRYAQGFEEGHGVGRVPSSAVSGVRYPRLERWGPRAVRGAGWALLAFDAWVRTERVLDAPPEERGYETRKQVAGFAGSMVFPTLGPVAEYGVETAEKGPRAMSLAFPTVYTWLLDAYIGEELERQDPEGARLIRRAASGDAQATIDFWKGLTGVW